MTTPTVKNRNTESNQEQSLKNLLEIAKEADQLFFQTVFHKQQGGCKMNQAVINQHVNGVNVEQLGNTISAIQDQAELAKFTFRATNKWINGGENETTIKEFYGACQEDQTRKEPFLLGADEPPVLLGKDKSANPAEYVLHALASCLTTSLVYHAAARGIKIEEVESKLDGDIDLHGFLGLSEDIRNGYQNIRVSFKVKGDATKEQLQELAKRSPVFDIVSNPVAVDLQFETI